MVPSSSTGDWGKPGKMEAPVPFPDVGLEDSRKERNQAAVAVMKALRSERSCCCLRPAPCKPLGAPGSHPRDTHPGAGATPLLRVETVTGVPSAGSQHLCLN